MNRSFCFNHVNHIGVGRTARLDSKKCSICKWNKRSKTLPDLARMFEGASSAMRYAYEHPDLDPIGLSWAPELDKAIVEYVRGMHSSYRSNLLKTLGEIK